jgi:hypothetical protein
METIETTKKKYRKILRDKKITKKKKPKKKRNENKNNDEIIKNTKVKNKHFIFIIQKNNTNKKT